jgi:hypothetical protein
MRKLLKLRMLSKKGEAWGIYADAENEVKSGVIEDLRKHWKTI